MDRIEIYLDAAKKWRWRYVRAGNNEKMAEGGEGYTWLRDLIEALEIVFHAELLGPGHAPTGLGWSVHGAEVEIRYVNP